MVDAELGVTVAFNGCIYNHHELRRELEAARLPVLLDRRHRGHRQGLPALGRQLRRAPHGHVRLLPRRARHRAGWCSARDRLGIKPLYLAEVGGQAAVRLDAAGPAGRGRRRHVDRPGRAAPVPDVPLGGARAPHDPAGGAEAAARHAAGRRARRTPARVHLLAHRLRPPPRARGLVGPGLGGRDPGRPAHRRRPAHGGRRAGRVPAVGRPRLEPHRRAAGRGRRARPAHLQHRVRVARRHRGRRVPLLRRDRRAVRHRPPPHPHQQRSPAAGAGRRHRGDERADGQPRRRRLLPAVAGGGEAREGRAVGPGRRRGLRRLPLVPADARARCGSGRGRRSPIGGVLRPARRGDGRGGRGRPPVSRRRRRAPSSAATSPARAPRRPSTGRCASTPRSCSSTTR